jgi:hypothetical protein
MQLPDVLMMEVINESVIKLHNPINYTVVSDENVSANCIMKPECAVNETIPIVNNR